MSRWLGLFERFRPARAAGADSALTESERIGWVVIGLGNPGEQYRRSRHNIGFMAIQHLAARHKAALTRRKFNGLLNDMRHDDGRMIVAAPQTFYNRSGDCVHPLLSYYKVPPARLIVIHDEMDLPQRQIRLQRGGGDAGNRGVRSIAEALGTGDFVRVRIGVAHPSGPDTIDYLLQPLSREELDSFAAVFERVADAVLAIMREGLEPARRVYNQRA